MPTFLDKLTATATCGFVGLALTVSHAPSVVAEGHASLTTSQIDALVERSMSTFEVPGMAVGIIKDGKIVHLKGYGVRETGKKAKVNTETLFAIASVSKAFTAASLAMLVDDGKLNWDDKVIDFIPNFRMYDPWVTREFTVKDLLIHNSGMGLGAGDLMFWPTSAFSREEIIGNLRYLKPVTSFRSEFAYDNLLYVVAGEVVAKISGMEFEDFVDSRILTPLKMDRCAANRIGLKGDKNIAEPHLVLDGELQKTFRLAEPYERSILAAAGGLQCSADSMLKWFNMHINKGKLPNGDVLISEKQQAMLMTSQTIRNTRGFEEQYMGNSFASYGLGWGLKDLYGYKVATHTGGLQGMVTYATIVPDLGLGIIILTNQQSGAAMGAINYGILGAYAAGDDTDFVAVALKNRTAAIEAANKVVADAAAESYTSSVPLARYAGTYKDAWFGDVVISETDGGLKFRSVRSGRLVGMMEAYKPNTFIVRWDDRSLLADAYVKFTTDYDDRPHGITMKAVSPLTDFSFDFHDLDFKRVK